MIKEAAEKKIDLLVIAEQVVQGYFHNLVGPCTTEIIQYHLDNAEVVPEGESTKRIIKAAMEYGIYVAYGMTERDRTYDYILYNTAVLVGPEGFVGHYRKVHSPLLEQHVYTPGNEYPVFDTKIGKIGLQICYDQIFPESTREMALQGAEIVCELMAWEENIGDEIEETGKKFGARAELYGCVRAMENQIFFITSNMVGKNEMGDFCGLSQIVDPNGYVIASCGMEEGIAYADIDLEADIRKNWANLLQKYIMARRPDAYKRVTGGEGMKDILPLYNKENNIE